jgi:Ca2+-binding RTX toxin-like protein
VSTPTSNSVRMTRLNTSGLGNEGTIIQGVKWGGGWGGGVDLTISFPGSGGATAYKSTPYGFYSPDEWSNWTFLSASEQAGVRAALISWSLVANIDFFEVADNSAVVGDLRFARSGILGGGENAHAYYPANDPSAGDVWMNNNLWHTGYTTAVTPGTYDYVTLIHEIGHALGLKHTFSGARKMPAQFDSYSFTVMSYTASTETPGNNYADFYPTTPMYYDLLAIQELYGTRPHNAGSNTYTYVQGNHYWETIDDSGGTDTIQYYGSNGVTIDLRAGHWSTLGLQINFANGKSQAATVCIGPRSVIENAVGGDGGDLLIGNAARNTLIGNAGADRLVGSRGADLLSGGDNNDIFDFNLAKDSGRGASRDVISDFSGLGGQFDKIDLLGIDAKQGAGNQAFTFIGGARFHDRAGELHVVSKNGFLLVEGDINGDGRADFQIEVRGAAALSTSDFFL